MKENQFFISFKFKLICAIFLFVLVFIFSSLIGAMKVSLKDVWLAVITNPHKGNIAIIHEIRLPREIAAIFVGAALAVSGAVMQGLTKNPLADPGLLGLTAGANAALAITTAFMPSSNYIIVLVSCFIGSTFGIVLVFGISSMKKGGFDPFRVVLAGAAVSSFLYAVAEGIGIYYKISKDVSLWTSGGLIGTSWSQLYIIVPFISLGILVSIILSKQLTVLSLSEEIAVGLGQKTIQVKIVLFAVIAVLTGASVALVGNIAFIGLMIPHIVRMIVGTDYRFILPLSIFLGSTLMLFADMIGRTINAPYETPVAAIVCIMGLPFFLFIVHKGGRAFS